jgi:CheY-like chemotaxis protein
VLTGSDRDSDIQTSNRLGAAAYIVKPVDLRNLAKVTPQLRFQWALLKPPPAGEAPAENHLSL